MGPGPDGASRSGRTRRRALLRWVLAGLLAAVSGFGCAEPRQDDTAKADPLSQLPLAGTRPRVLRIGMTPSSGANTADVLAPLVTYLETRLQMPVTAVTADAYEDVERLVRERAVEVGIFAPLSYVQAALSPRRTGSAPLNGVAIATVTRRGSPTYLGYLIVRADDGARQLEDLRGRPIAWVSKSSTSGYLYPRALIRHKGLLEGTRCADRFFGDPTFAKDHLEAIRAVHNRRADVAAVGAPFVEVGSLNPLTKDLGSEQKGRQALRIIAKTDRIPLDCIVVRADVSQGVARQLRQALLTLHEDDEVSRALQDSWSMNGFVEPMHQTYEAIEETETAEEGSCK